MIGLDYPIQNSRDEGFFGTTETTTEHVRSSIINVLSTQKGERPMRPGFGTRLREMLFRPLNPGFESEVKEQIEIAVETWLPYVDIEDVSVKLGDDAALVNLSFTTDFDRSSSDVEFVVESDAA